MLSVNIFLISCKCIKFAILLGSPSSTLANGSVLFWDSNFLYPVNGQNSYFGTGAGRSFAQFQLGYEGIIKTAVTAC